jgi:hypothetical protein
VSDPVAAPWRGAGIDPYEVGDPGRAAREVTASLPLAPNDPADTQLDSGAAGSLELRAASVRGVSHRHAGTPRQDDYALALADGWLIVAVADGVSAGALSHQAATLACRGAATQVKDALQAGRRLEELAWDEVLTTAARRIVAHGLRALATEEQPEPATADVAKAMSTTLVVTVVATEPDADGLHRGVVLAFGDCSVFRLSAGTWDAVTAIKNDGADVATSATVALPYVPENAPAALDFALAPGESAFVMTDGVGDPLGPGEGAVGMFLASVWELPPDALSFAAQVGFARKSFDDDRTVVGIWAGA